MLWLRGEDSWTSRLDTKVDTVSRGFLGPRTSSWSCRVLPIPQLHETGMRFRITEGTLRGVSLLQQLYPAHTPTKTLGFCLVLVTGASTCLQVLPAAHAWVLAPADLPPQCRRLPAWISEYHKPGFLTAILCLPFGTPPLLCVGLPTTDSLLVLPKVVPHHTFQMPSSTFTAPSASWVSLEPVYSRR